MDELIQTINELQQYNRKYDLANIDLPQIIVVGSQSTGKSSVLERIIGYDILPKGSTIATRCPIIIQMTNVNESSDPNLIALFNGEKDYIIGPDRISEKLQELTNQVNTGKQRISNKPIVVQLFSHSVPTLTIVDMPGIIRNDGDMETGSSETIRSLSEEYAQNPLSIILAVSAANVDLANSDSIEIAHKYDKEGQRTIHVLTKVDLMDQGTSVLDMLKSSYLEKALSRICLVNRSQKNISDRRPLEQAKEDEMEFFKRHYKHICKDHGISTLTTKLVRTLSKQIAQNLPNMKNEVAEKIEDLEQYLESINFNTCENILGKSIRKFIENYSNFITGRKECDGDEIVGGAKISILLYEVFENDLKHSQVTNLTRERISKTLINCCGNRRISYSLEETFRQLISNQIRGFEDPCIKCLNGVRDLLREFVKEIINELQISPLQNFTLRLEETMCSVITDHYQKTRKVIHDVVRSEATDVFCAHPNSNFFNKLSGNLQDKIKTTDDNVFGNILDTVTETIDSALPPAARGLLTTANKIGVLDQVKGVVNDTCNYTTDLITSIFQNNELDELDRTELDDFLENRDEFEKILIQIDTAEKKLMKNPERKLDIDIVETMVHEYFDMVRNNIVYNVPKWIQTLLIYDLLENIKDDLPIMIENDKDELMKLDPELEDNIRRNEEKLEELKIIYQNLWKIKG